MPAVMPPHPPRTRQTFAIQLLQSLGVPVTENNIKAMLAQMLAEEPPGEGARNNPLNTTMDADKYPLFAGHFPHYPSWQVGINETADTYKEAYYTAVIRDLRASADPNKTASDIGASKWGTSGDLMHQVLGGGGDLAKDAVIPGTGDASYTRSTGFQTDPISSGISSAKDAVMSVPNAIGDALSSIEGFALRGGKILLGVLLLVAAIYFGVVK